MKFINRHNEFERLENLLRGHEGGLAVVWGRRRIGKTELLLEWVKAHGGIYWVADQSAPSLQRESFARLLSEKFPGFADVAYPAWDSFLGRLAQASIAHGWIGPLVIDEFPYLVATSTELPSVMQRWVDHDMRSARLRVAIAGSSQRMMQGLVLDGNAPLYGRARQAFCLFPIGAGYMSDAFGKLSSRSLVEHFSLWGGVPHYWRLAIEAGAAGLEQCVDMVVLDPLGPLHNEPNRLLLEENPPAIALRPVLDAIGQGAHRLSEIAGRIGQPATSLYRPLERLQEMQLIEREVPFGESAKSSKRSLYKIIDPFFRFWFTVVAPNAAYFPQSPRGTRIELFRRRKACLVSAAWEELCRAAIPKITVGALAKTGPWLPGRRYWHGNGPEWDCICESVDRKRMLIAEMKWTNDNQQAADLTNAYQNLLAKGLPPVAGFDKKEICHALFVPEKPKGAKIPDRCAVIDAATVLSALR